MKDEALVAKGLCGRRKPRGKGFCNLPAGSGTEHLGEGPCKFHGGGKGIGRPIIHGRYSKVQLKSTRLADLIAEFDADPDPLNILPDLKLARAVMVDFLERGDEFNRAILAWHGTYSKEYQEARKAWVKANRGKPEEEWSDIPDPVGYGKPVKLLEVSQVVTFAEKLSNVADKIERQRDKGMISMLTMNYILEQHGVELVAAVRETVDDPDLQAAIVGAVERRWENIPIDAKRPAASTAAE